MSRASIELITWLRANSIPLDTVEPGNGFGDLKPLGDLIADARVVTVCEASHGIRDIFQLKHRLFEYLVAEHDFTTLVVTASYADSFSLWRYINGEDVDPSLALAEMRWWTIDSEEILDLVRWMRTYNEDRGTTRKLSFYGCDVNAPASGAHRLIEYLGKVDDALAKEVARSLAPIATDLGASRFNFASESSKSRVSKAIPALVEKFSTQAESWTRRTSQTEFERARLAARGLEQRLESLLDRASAWQVKDKSCAENIRHILQLEGPDSKVMVWTHNGHGQRAPFKPGVRPMGDMLDELFGDKHVIVGTAFGEGSLRAIDPATNTLRDFEVLPSSAETLDGALAEIEHPVYAVVCRSMPDIGEAAQWLSTRPGSRFTGSDFSDDPATLTEIYEEAYKLPSEFAPTDPRACFDVLVFMRSVAAAKSNWPVSPAGPVAPTHDAPTNLDFAAVDDEGFPDGWTVQAGREPGRHRIDIEGGKVVISRPGVPWSWGEGVVSQRFSAREFAGRGLTLSASVTTKTEGVHCTALLSIQAHDKRGQPIAAETMEARPGRSSVEMLVPAGAEVLEIGLAYSGNGLSTFSGIDVSAGS